MVAGSIEIVQAIHKKIQSCYGNDDYRASLEQGYTQACSAGITDLVRFYLTEYKAFLNPHQIRHQFRARKSINDPLLFAICKGHRAVVELPLDPGADIKTRDVLTFAIENTEHECLFSMIQFLLDHKALFSEAAAGATENLARNLLDASFLGS